MRKLSVGIASVLFGLVFTSSGYAHGLAGSSWVVQGNSKQVLQFGPVGRLYGNGGCNRFFGTYTEEDAHVLKVGPIAGTRKLCEKNVMEAERRFFKSLEATASFRLNKSGTVLTLVFANGKRSLRFNVNE